MERNPYLRGGRRGVSMAHAIAAMQDDDVTDTIGQTASPHLKFNLSKAQISQLLNQHGANVATAMAKSGMSGKPALHLSFAGGTRAPNASEVSNYPSAPAWNPKVVPSVPFGVDSGATLITAGSAATITVFPQARCVPSTMALTELIAETFIGANLVVGVQPLLVTTGTISLAQFVQNSTLPTFQRIMLTPGTQFQIVVTNISGASARFIANVIAEDWREMAAA